MKHRTEEQERILNLAKWGECREILEELSERQLRSFPPAFTSRLLFEVVPLNTRPARELAMFVFEHGRWDWREPDDEGMLLHKVLIQNERVEMAAKAAARLRKRDAGNPDLAPVWAELLCYLLEKQQRSAAAAMLNKGVLKYVDEDDLDEVFRRILSYKDIELLDTVVRSTKVIPVELIPVPENLSDYQFTRELLNRHTKEIEIKDNEKILWKLAILCEAEVMTERLLKKTKDYQYLPRLAEGSNTLFELLLHIRCRDILDEVKKEVLYGALRSDRWKERFELLAGKGWKKSSQNHKEAIRLTDDYLKILGTKKYAPGRRGHLDQINDRARLRFIRVYEQKKKL